MKKRREKHSSFLIHFSGILLLFLLPEFLISFTSPGSRGVPPGIYVKVLIYALVFYANFYFIIERYLVARHNWGRFTLYNIAVVTVAMLMLHLSWTHFDPGPKLPLHGAGPSAPNTLPLHQQGVIPGLAPAESALPIAAAVRDFIILVLTIALSVAIRLNFRWMEMERDRQQMDALRREIELSQLRSQLNPHFLFNTLNGIYALVDIDPSRAKQAIHRLSQLLRYMLYGVSHGPSTVKSEIDFIKDYIELVRMRMNPDFPVEVDLQCGPAAELPIHPFLFINIIENAFKFGITDLDPTHRICIRITGRPDGVECVTSNTYSPDVVASYVHRSGGGIGLANLRRSLELRYPRQHTLEVNDTGHLFTVRLDINLDTRHCPSHGSSVAAQPIP